MWIDGASATIAGIADGGWEERKKKQERKKKVEEMSRVGEKKSKEENDFLSRRRRDLFFSTRGCLGRKGSRSEKTAEPRIYNN